MYLESKPDICEKHVEVQKAVYICFLDYEKALNRVRHQTLMQCLSEIGVDGKDIQIIRNLYWDQTELVRIMNELSDDDEDEFIWLHMQNTIAAIMQR